MTARAIWKGVIRFGSVQLPVKLYTALEDQGIHFHLLHDADHVRIQQRMINPETGKSVPYSETLKGLEVERDVFMPLTAEELKALEPEPSRDIEILQFVDPREINHQWYDRPYWLGPDDGDQAYFAFAEALAKQKKEGVVRWVMRGKSYLGSLQVSSGFLSLVTLRSVESVIDAGELDAPKGRDLSDKELQLARQLMDTLQDEFRPEDYHDGYRQRVRELIEAKQKGRKLKAKPARRRAARKSLAESLEASLTQRRPSKV